jgi:hypothetical protein
MTTLSTYQQAVVDEARGRELQAEAERDAAIREAVTHMGEGTPGRVYALVMRSYLRQVRILGLGYAGIPGRPYEEGGLLP